MLIKHDIYYYPMAVTEDGEKLFTCTSAFTTEDALNQFSIWEDHYNYKIKDAYIDCTNGERVEVKKRWVIVK